MTRKVMMTTLVQLRAWLLGVAMVLFVRHSCDSARVLTLEFSPSLCSSTLDLLHSSRAEP
jgi:hypothetical protein